MRKRKLKRLLKDRDAEIAELQNLVKELNDENLAWATSDAFMPGQFAVAKLPHFNREAIEISDDT